MHKLLTLIFINCIGLFALAQPVTPVYNNMDGVNTVRIWEANKRTIDANTITITSPVQDFKMTTQYSDGLGRPLETVLKGGSLTTTTGVQTDIVSANVYDELGREKYKYLPFAATTNDGSFKLDPFQQQANFYSNPNGILKGQQESYFYSQANFDGSPLNRATQTLAPGNSWVGSNVGISSDYDINNTSENVRVWQIDYTTGSIPSSPSAYATGQLFKNITIDENGKKVITYTDKSGNVILKKVQLSNTPGIDNTGWLCTYYVYDDFGRQRFIIPPKAVTYLDANNWILSNDVVNELCFSNEYDKRGRLIIKKSPGADPVYMVYDQRDRLVFSQDGNQRQQATKNWTVTLYDNLDRVSLTGLFDYNSTRNNLQSWVDNIAANGDNSVINVNSSTSPAVNLVVDQRVVPAGTDPGYKASNSITFNTGFTSEDGANFVAEIDPSAPTANNSVAVNGNPLPANNNLYTLTLSFYDDYSYTGAKTYSTNFTIDNTIPSNESEAVQQSVLTRGFVTGSKVRLLDGSNNFLTTTSFYDDKGRAIQLQGDNHKGFTDEATTQFDFSGKVRSAYEVTRFDGLGGTKIFTKNTFDFLGRVTAINKSINGSSEKTIATYNYNELGQLVLKVLAPGFIGEDGSQIESLEYAYNIHGSLLGINKDYSASVTREGHYFGMELGYDKTGTPGFTNLQTNGNIAGNAWKTRGDNTIRKYDYSYDNANQLLNASFNQRNISSSGWSADKMNFTSNNTYDVNGNILTQNQWGVAPGTGPQQIDQLVYHYDLVAGEWTNKLKSISESSATASNGKLGDFKNGTVGSSSPQYDYDYNGNLKKDLNKEIGDVGTAGIQYNFMDLPTLITFKNTNKTIAYVYDAAGNKLRKILDEPAVGNIPARHVETDYVNDFVYENNELQFFSYEEGRVRKQTDGNFVWDYFIKDHLTNVRMILTEEQRQDIYPVATLEGNTQSQLTDPLVVEKTFYTIDENNIKPKIEAFNITDYPNNNGNPPINNNPNCNDNSPIKQTDLSQKVYRLNSSVAKTGLGITLKVMSGDKIDILGLSYYSQNNSGGHQGDQLTTVTNFILGLLGTPTGVTTGKASPTDLEGNTSIVGDLLSFINNPNRNDPSQPLKPRAAINWILLNEQFEYVAGNFSPVGDLNVVKPHYYNDPQLQNIPVTKNGYLYVYVSNESPVNVFFDNLQVIHTRGRMLEETHYYSYGLKIAGISSKAFDAPNNPYQYQGDYSEFDDETGWNDFELRSYDAQIGRFINVDPYDQFASGYVGMGNDPINNVDPSGGFSLDFGTIGQITGSVLADRALITLGGAAIGYGIDKLTGGNGWKGAAIGGAVGLGATFIPPINFGNIGNALGNAGQWVGDAVKSVGTSTSVANSAAGSVIRFRSWFKLMGEATISTFNATARGLQIELLYKNVNSKLTNFNWIQAIRTNTPLGGATSPYNDPQPPDDSKPFYWTDAELPTENVAPGYDGRFADAPSRGVDPTKTTTWKAELSVVGKNAAGAYKSIGTLKYGFKIKPNGTVSINGVGKRWTSGFQKGIIKTAR